jgi:hypothetical protein
MQTMPCFVWKQQERLVRPEYIVLDYIDPKTRSILVLTREYVHVFYSSSHICQYQINLCKTN